MADYSIYKFYKGEEKNPYSGYTPKMECHFWTLESYFEWYYNTIDGSEWYKMLGGDFINLLPFNEKGAEEAYQQCKESIKKDMLFFDYLIRETEKLSKKELDIYLNNNE